MAGGTGGGEVGEGQVNYKHRYWSCLFPRTGSNSLISLFALLREAVQETPKANHFNYKVIIFNSLFPLECTFTSHY